MRYQRRRKKHLLRKKRKRKQNRRSRGGASRRRRGSGKLTRLAILKLIATPFRFMNTFRQQIIGSVNDATYHDACATGASRVPLALDQIKLIAGYVEGVSTAFAGLPESCILDKLIHRYRVLNDGNQKIKVTAYVCCPKKDMPLASDTPMKSISDSITNTDENPVDVANVRYQVNSATDVDLYPSDYWAFRKHWRIVKTHSRILDADEELRFNVSNYNLSLSGYSFTDVQYKANLTKFVMVRIQGTITSETTLATHYVGYCKPCCSIICDVRGVARSPIESPDSRVGRLFLGGPSNSLNLSAANPGRVYTTVNDAAIVQCNDEPIV